MTQVLQPPNDGQFVLSFLSNHGGTENMENTF